MAGIITLTTDFGDGGGYVAAIKGVILSANPGVQLVDISHRIAPQNVFEAAFVLSTVYRNFPRSTVHLVVVDPGVGTSRKILALKTTDGFFVGPDNGVFSYVLRDYVKNTEASGAGGLKKAFLTGDAKAVFVTNSRFFRNPVSDTFHGRDIMAPVAALLTEGFLIGAFGQAADGVNMFDLPRPEKSPDGSLAGHVIYADSFGNVITDVRAIDLPSGPLGVEAGNETISGLSHTYGEGNGLLALIGSAGYLEIALMGGSAAALTGLRVGDAVKINSLPSPE